MPNIKSAIKRVKTSQNRNDKNISQKSSLRTAIKAFETAVNNNDVNDAQGKLAIANKKLDKAVTKGLVHKNTAARKKSRLSKKLNLLQTEQSA